MSKKNIIVSIVTVLVVIGVVLLIYKQNILQNIYSVVYLTTGDVYIGKLSTFPDLELHNGYILQVTKDATGQSNFQLQPVNQVLWASDVLHLTRKNVVFYGPILPTSKIGQALAQEK